MSRDPVIFSGLELFGSEQEPAEGSCKYVREPCGSINRGFFFRSERGVTDEVKRPGPNRGNTSAFDCRDRKKQLKTSIKSSCVPSSIET
jgi:hypothetical protein